MEFLLEFIAEFLFQLVFEVLFAAIDGGLHASSRIVRNSVKVIFYSALGVVVGAFSVSIWPTPLITLVPNPWISLLLVPFSVAIFIVYFSRWLEAQRNWETELEHFSLSFILAFVFATTRYLYLIKVI